MNSVSTEAYCDAIPNLLLVSILQVLSKTLTFLQQSPMQQLSHLPQNNNKAY
jgi:hypothetical protein